MLLGVTLMGKKYYNMIHTDFTLYNQKKCQKNVSQNSRMAYFKFASHASSGTYPVNLRWS